MCGIDIPISILRIGGIKDKEGSLMDRLHAYIALEMATKVLAQVNPFPNAIVVCPIVLILVKAAVSDSRLGRDLQVVSRSSESAVNVLPIIMLHAIDNIPNEAKMMPKIGETHNEQPMINVMINKNIKLLFRPSENPFMNVIVDPHSACLAIDCAGLKRLDVRYSDEKQIIMVPINPMR